MTDLLFLLFTGFALGITGAMIPGPLTLFTVSETLKTDRFAGLKIASGHIVIEFVLLAVIATGFKKFINSESFLSTVSTVGGIALIIMGIILIIKSPKMKILDTESKAEFNKGLFAGGFLFSGISPGFIVWWATIGLSTIIMALLHGVIGVLFLMVGHWLADAVWLHSLSYAVDKGKKHLSNRSYRNIIKFFSLLLMILGLHFLIKLPIPFL